MNYDVMHQVDYVIKRDVYPQKMHSCSKNIPGLSIFVLKISVVYQEKKYIIGVIAWVFRCLKGKSSIHLPHILDQYRDVTVLVFENRT